MPVDANEYHSDSPRDAAPEVSGDADRSTSRSRRHPLGPLVEIRRLANPRLGRIWAACVVLGCGAVLAIAVSVSPSRDGVGTHRQLSIYHYPCGFLTMTGLPCPTCGMTTAFAHTVRGQLLSAIRVQVGGFLIAMLTIAAFTGGVFTLVSGQYATPNWYRINPMASLWWGVGILVAAWVIKVMIALLDDPSSGR